MENNIIEKLFYLLQKINNVVLFLNSKKSPESYSNSYIIF